MESVHQLFDPLFSAYAEVFLSPGRRCLGQPRFSLPTQRCFPGQKYHLNHQALFSAYAEVFLVAVVLDSVVRAFLCLRRGVSPC